MKKVLGAGSPILDLLLNVEEDFISGIRGGKGGMVQVGPDEMDGIIRKSAASPSRVPGGSSANTIFGLARLGIPTAFLGKVGEDAEGRFYVERYRSFGGDTRSFRSTSQKHTGRCLSLVTPDSERTMRTDLGAAALLAPEDVSPADFQGIHLVHTEGYLLYNRPLLMRILQLAKENSCLVSLDLASYEVVNASKDILPEVLEKYVDIVFSNEDEARAFTGTDDLSAALEKLSRLCPVAAVKLGGKGSVIRADREEVRCSAVAVEKPVDTTGAGDLWATGFIYGYLNGKGLAECGGYGSLIGAETVKVMGASLPDDRWDYILGKIKN